LTVPGVVPVKLSVCVIVAVKVALLTAPVTVFETVPNVHLKVLPDTPSAVEISLVLPLQKLSKRPCPFVSEKQKILITKMDIPNAILFNDFKPEKFFYQGRY
jgi:hypothetical protein